MTSSVETDKPFHAVIVEGDPVARKKLGLYLAQRMVCTDPDHTGKRPCTLCRDCRKAAEGIHPDVIPVERFMEEKDIGGDVKIAPIRALRADAFIRPNEAVRKVYLIDNAQTMNPSAQNALLKLLEEGPDYAAFLLLTDASGALLETIRSRCVLEHAGADETDREPSEQARELARILCGGSELDRVTLLTAMELSKPDRAAVEQFLDDLERLLQQALVGGVTGRFDWEESRLLARSRSRSDLLAMAEQTRKARDMTPFHVAVGHLMGWLGVALGAPTAD